MRILILCILILFIFTGISYGELWTVTNNPSSGVEPARSITSDNDYLYIAGDDYSPGNTQWRIEKRSKSTGALIWVQTSNPSSGTDTVRSITSDNDYLYIAGDDYSPGNNQCRVEKRFKSTGALIWAQTNSGSFGVAAYSITSDNDYLYISGFSLTPSFHWHIEKRFKSTGALIWVQTNNPASGFMWTAYSITSDNDYLYIAGYNRVPGDEQWYIEKRFKSTGALIWAQANNYSSSIPGNDWPYSITSDNDYLYIAGYNRVPGDWQWCIEKRFKSTGALIWVQTSNPSSTATYEAAYSITSDNDYLYIAGADYSPALSPKWRIEKRFKSTGALRWVQTNSDSFGDGAYSITSDNDYLYIAGFDYSPGNTQWRIEKCFKFFIDIGLRAYDGTNVVAIACEPEGAANSALRIGKDNKVYGVALVELANPDASKVRIKAPSGIKALRRF